MPVCSCKVCNSVYLLSPHKPSGTVSHVMFTCDVHMLCFIVMYIGALCARMSINKAGAAVAGCNYMSEFMGTSVE